MTERLYYRDAYLLSFEAHITGVGETADGYYTVLDRSAFYPTSGGQQCDHGHLSDIEINDVTESREGEVRHLSAAPVGEVGMMVVGKIDVARRRRHRQQHTAQHILSQVFIKLYGHATVSVHLGEEYGAVELETPALTPEQLTSAELMANEFVLENHPVKILFVEGEELGALPLRKVPEREGPVRVVQTGQFDWSACGGTHCAGTAEVGMIKIVGQEKLRGHALVKFLAGEQALEDYHQRFAVTSGLASDMTCHVQDLPGKVARLQAENKDLRQTLLGLYRELLPQRAEMLAAAAEAVGSTKLACAAIDVPDPKIAAQLATAVADRIAGVALLLTDKRVFLATSAVSGFEAGKLARQLGEKCNLKGGGSKTAAQLGGADPESLNEYRRVLVDLLGSD